MDEAIEEEQGVQELTGHLEFPGDFIDADRWDLEYDY
jgi:hypothetical protein